jgi:type IV pilus assembly protein PilE
MLRRTNLSIPHLRAMLVSTYTHRRRGGHSGFTLIELMITVAIVAILAAVALPSYSQYMRKARRGDAQSFMSEVAARQQHFLLDRRAYSTSITDAPASGGLGMTIPSNVSSFYTVTIPPDSVTTQPPAFIVQAVPTGSQTEDTCATLRLNQAGQKTATGTGSCW